MASLTFTTSHVPTLQARIERLEAENRRLSDALSEIQNTDYGKVVAENDRFCQAIIAKDNSLLRLVRECRDVIEELSDYGHYGDLLDEIYEALGEPNPWIDSNDEEDGDNNAKTATNLETPAR